MGAYGAYTLFEKHSQPGSELALMPVAHAAGKFAASQASVFSPTKEHALYLWIHLSPTADAKKCAKVVSDIQAHVDAVSPAADRDESNEILAGVGFGHGFYKKVAGSAKKDFNYAERRGQLGNMPSTGGDIFIHAKSDSVSKLFELCQYVTSQMPFGSVERFEDIYSFVYRNGRDLSGFIDGTENPAAEEDRQSVAVEPETGGSYVITQKWIHRLDFLAREKTAQLEKFVGRTREHSTELEKKPATSHVARMTAGTASDQKKPFEIVRQSMPFGTLSDKAGLFFIAYAASPENFNYMLDRMVGKDKDGLHDDVMRMSECVSSTYWYFPGAVELKKLAGR
jgi:porphyrinogen peroxidase